jgi:cobalt-zinc-cadmium efflux system membrane fusion protein
MLKNNFKPVTILLSMFILATACNGGREKGDTAEEAEILPDDIVEMRFDQIKMAEIDTGSVELRSLSGTLKASGQITVAPQGFATVCTPLGGFIKSTSLMPGDAVRKGQVLAIVENQEFVDIQENYLEARSRLEYAEGEYNRHSELYKEDVYSEKNLQQVTADYKGLRANVTALQQKLALIGIDPGSLNEDNISRSIGLISPINGFVKTVNVNIGKAVSATDILFEIINNEHLFLELTLFEKDAAKVTSGQDIDFFINNESEVHKALITHTGRSVDANKICRVYAEVTKGCNNILPGMYVNAVIETPGNKVTALPSDAIVTFDDKNYIFIFDRNKEEKGFAFTEYRIVEVRKGLTANGYTEVILPESFNGKTSGIVIKGAYNLLSAKKNAGEMAC